MISLAEKMERFPLKVYYPRTGKTAILVIHTEDAQQQFLMAPVKDGDFSDNPSALQNLQRMLEHKLMAAPWLTLREFWVGEIVTPPLRLREQFAEEKYRDAQSSFRSSVFRLAEQYAKGDRPLPPGIERCSPYEPDPDLFRSEGEDGTEYVREPDEHDRQYHADCRKCRGRSFVFTLDFDAFYEARRKDVAEWEATFYRPTKPDGLVVPTGRMASEHMDLWVALPNHGNHAKGNVMEKVDLTSDWLPYAHGGYSMPLFFFQGYKQDVPRWATLKVEAAAQQRMTKQTAQRKRDHDKRKHEMERANEFFLRLMEPVP